ncbi:hypothetical protein FR932_18320 [Moritella marina ATCC 15381]|uniref:Uncharacterized protein n=1 Tax=Moritella marina ATCC 15381 TaxID=1202962 RepID=A0A5J6WNR4_MORMI|nr:hypothetical protein [Moritella marina]QFI39627.1 hypothetical protein FR932_18320 [Moritella marina ATCC 15381]
MKAITVHRPTLKIIWKLLVFLFFPLVIWLYSVIADVSFADIDSGANYHKWIIFFLYLSCLATWLYIDRTLSHSSFFRH